MALLPLGNLAPKARVLRVGVDETVSARKIDRAGGTARHNDNE